MENVRLAQEAVLDEVMAENVTELLDSHGQQLSNGDLEKMAKELSQQKEEKRKMKSLLKNVQKQAINSMSFELWRPQLMSCDTDHDLEQCAKVKQSTVVSIGSTCNSGILRERNKEEISTLNTAYFLQNKGSYSTRDFIIEVKSLHYATIKKGQCRDLRVALTKTIGLGFKHIKVYKI